MTTQSAHPQSAAGPTPPTPPGPSSRAVAGRHSAAPGAELAAALRGGTGYERCYDLLAPQLYRYCWALLGPGGSGAEPDRAAAALRETYLAAAHSIGELRHDRDIAAWLFALARTAARRRGFTARSPYSQLPTTAAERAVVQLSLRLPPSHRELLELYLRHGLPTARIARVLGLSEETSAELCRAAVLRAAELLTRHSLAPDRTGRHGPDRGVRAVLADLEPPGPPLALRERVVQECASAQAADERRAAAEALAPLGADGFPLHRNRVPAATEDAEGTEKGGADEGGGGGPPTASAEPTALPRDRVTTGDVPARAEPEPVAEANAAGGSSPHRPRRRWLTPVTAVLASATVVATLWATVAMVRPDTDDTVTGSHLPAAPTAAPSEGAPGAGTDAAGGETSGADRLQPEALDDTTVTRPDAARPGGTQAPGQQEHPSAPAAPGGDPSAAPGAQSQGQDDQGQEQGQGQQEGAAGTGGGSGSAGQEDGGGSESGESGSGSGDGDSGGSRGPVSGLIGGLIDFLNPAG